MSAPHTKLFIGKRFLIYRHLKQLIKRLSYFCRYFVGRLFSTNIPSAFRLLLYLTISQTVLLIFTLPAEYAEQDLCITIERPSFRLSVCLSRRSTAAARCGWFAAELVRRQQVWIDSCWRRAPGIDRHVLPAPELRLRVSSC